ncbi:proline-rich receptor-like protein kinase PERK2 isoform X3 [Nymphaea colorata]|uniref:proline-rich receptor-like protein kinase PERK2 isoform X3 n=1 Tax=Nymphaea colorata TaxID=210225 RepID=UPI00129DC1EB|nr:proline-rich receptor-like protein kinase PERK2 isoform X3 [Nymphaea colorata]
MSRPLAAIIGGAAGALALVGITVAVIWYYLFHKRNNSRTSESSSSEPSAQDVGRSTSELSLIGGTLSSASREARHFSLRELELATKNFSDINLIGQGSFGLVYKGLLQDGMVVAIKKRHGAPRQEFVEEVRFLSSIRHRNLVTLHGYCQENDQQMLIYEHVPNGSVSNHIYGQYSTTKLEFKNRLLIAIGAAKGLRNLLERIINAGTSSQMMGTVVFLDPEFRESGRFSEKSDVYSFGVFLLELVSGCSAESDESMIKWAQNRPDLSDAASIIDEKLVSSFTSEGMKRFIGLAVWCIHSSGQRRPTMNTVVLELERIHEREISMTTIVGEGTPTVTLASQLFTA